LRAFDARPDARTHEVCHDQRCRSTTVRSAELTQRNSEVANAYCRLRMQAALRIGKLCLKIQCRWPVFSSNCYHRSHSLFSWSKCGNKTTFQKNKSRQKSSKTFDFIATSHCNYVEWTPVMYCLIMAALHSRCGRYIFALRFIFLSIFFPRLISAVTDWMFTSLLHMVWP